MKANSVQVNTRYYESNHGAAPRGRGQWAFCPEGQYSAVNYLDYVLSFNGSYGDAKRQAMRAFAARGVASLVVCA